MGRRPQSTRVEVEIADVPPRTERPVRDVLEEDGWRPPGVADQPFVGYHGTRPAPLDASAAKEVRYRCPPNH